MVMPNKFEKFWGSCDSLLTFGLIFYPLHKMLDRLIYRGLTRVA